MIYGERLKLAREKLGMDRMTLAILLDTTQQNIANIENCKDGTRKLGWDKMIKLLDTADLPKGYFIYDDQEFKDIVMDGTKVEVYARVMRGGSMLPEEIKEVLGLAEYFNKIHRP